MSRSPEAVVSPSGDASETSRDFQQATFKKHTMRTADLGQYRNGRSQTQRAGADDRDLGSPQA